MKKCGDLYYRLRVWRDDELTCDLVVQSANYHILCAVRECQENSARHFGQVLKIVQTSEVCDE